MLKKLLILILTIKLAVCESAPIGDFCDVYQYPGELGSKEVGRAIFNHNEHWGDSVLANKEYYELKCME